MAEARQVRQRVGHGGRRPQEDGRVLGHRTVDEDGRRGPQGTQRIVQAPRRNDDEPVDLPGQRLHRPHLFVRVLAGIHQQHLQIRLPGRPLHRPHQRGEVWIGDVGNDDGDVAGPPGDEAARGTVRDEAELPYRRLDPLPGLRCDLLRDIDCARHRCRVHAGTLPQRRGWSLVARAAPRWTLLGGPRTPG